MIFRWVLHLLLEYIAFGVLFFCCVGWNGDDGSEDKFFIGLDSKADKGCTAVVGRRVKFLLCARG